MRTVSPVFALTLFLGTAPALAETEAVPSLELLEFLADWQDPQGEWLDPMVLQPDDETETRDDQSKGKDDE